MREACKRHRKGDGSWWATDARGIPTNRVCENCEDINAGRGFRREVMENPNYEADEPIDGDY